MDDPAQFYTGLVASLYGPLRGSIPDPDVYAAFIARYGQPALELGCGTGDPLIELRRRGLEIDGLDSSADMLAICRQRAADAGVTVNVCEALIEDMELGAVYKSIFLAGPTFNLLPDDDTAVRSLRSIKDHLAPDGRALIPLFIPSAVPDAALNQWRETVDDDSRPIRFAVTAVTRDEAARIQTSTLRYERGDGDDVEIVERDWLIHWYSIAQFTRIVEDVGLTVQRVTDATGAPAPAPDDATEFAFTLRAE